MRSPSLSTLNGKLVEMAAAGGSPQCAGHVNHKEVGTFPFPARLDVNSSRDSFGTCRERTELYLQGMPTTWECFQAGPAQTPQTCRDVSLSSGEQGTVQITSGGGTGMGMESSLPPSQTDWKQCTKHDAILCVCSLFSTCIQTLALLFHSLLLLP